MDVDSSLEQIFPDSGRFGDRSLSKLYHRDGDDRSGGMHGHASSMVQKGPHCNYSCKFRRAIKLFRPSFQALTLIVAVACERMVSGGIGVGTDVPRLAAGLVLIGGTLFAGVLLASLSIWLLAELAEQWAISVARARSRQSD